MKRILLLLMFGLGFFAQAQTPITVDDTQTVQQLIEDVLILGNCAEVNNVNSPNNSIIGGDSFESYGAFDGSAASPDFPFDSGIILATNGVNMIPTGTPLEGGGFGWAGDPDLEALIDQPGNTNNATVIEFDFIPFVEEISFNYFLASDEWPTFVCDYADTFAFIISGPGISNVNDYDHDANPNTPDLSLDLGGLNIATIPGTNIPVNPTNIHDLTATCGAGALGEFAVPQLYDGAADNDGTTMYNGRTVPLFAEASVIPGLTYTIKLAIADRADTAFNSAVFIESASFDLGGIDLGPDITISNGNAACEGDIVTLDAGFSANNIQYFWAVDGEIIPDENNQTLEVTQPGVYEVGIQIGATGAACFGVSNAVTIEFFPDPAFDVSEPVVLCQGDTITLNGEPTNAATYTSLDYTWLRDGVELTGETNSTLDVTEGGVYEVVVDANACDDATNSFTVNLLDYEVSLPAVPDPCISSGDTVTLSPAFTGLTQDEIDNGVTYEWTTDNGVFTTPTIDISEGQTVSLTTSIEGCEESVTETFTFFNNPEVDIAGADILCGGDTNTLNATPVNLNDLDQDNLSYTWTLDGDLIDGDGPTLDVTQGGLYQVVINNNGCETSDTFEVELVDYTVSFEEEEITICTGGGTSGSVELQPVITGLTTAQENQTFFNWSDGSSEETLTVNESGTYSVEVNINGNCVQSAEVLVTLIETVQATVNDAIKCPGDSVTLESTLSSDVAGVTYQWTLNGEVVGTTASISVEEEGDYTLVVNNQGCESDPVVANVSGYEVDECTITQGISPNEDGLNDCMDLTWLNDESGIKNIKVFNRYGRKVFEENNYTNTFCGQDENGDELSTGTYFYVIELERESVKLQKGPVIKGWIYVNIPQN